MSAGECQTKNKNDYDNEEDDKPIIALDEGKLDDMRHLLNRPLKLYAFDH